MKCNGGSGSIRYKRDLMIPCEAVEILQRKKERGGSAAVAARRRLLERQWKDRWKLPRSQPIRLIHAGICTHDVNKLRSEITPNYSIPATNDKEDSGHTASVYRY